jgi:hypothetical protein
MALTFSASRAGDEERVYVRRWTEALLSQNHKSTQQDWAEACWIDTALFRMPANG